MRLHITSNERMAGLIRATGVDGEVLAWQDPLYEGPVKPLPLHQLAVMRARYFADMGLGNEAELLGKFGNIHAALSNPKTYGEIVLWFGNNLYDQLQLLQLLSWFTRQETGHTEIFLIQIRFPAQATPDVLKQSWARRVEISVLQSEIGSEVWARICDEDPRAVQYFNPSDLSSLPLLRAAIQRLLHQFPSKLNGLNQSERHILEIMSTGESDPEQIYLRSQKKEEQPFLSQTMFWFTVKRLASGERPLLGFETREKVEKRDGFDAIRKEEHLVMTDFGRDVLRYKADWLQENGIDRWIGGVHLQAGNVWRWDPKRKQLTRTYV